MFINFPMKATNYATFEARAKERGWMDADGMLAPGVQLAYLGRVITGTDANGDPILSDYDRMDVRLHSVKAKEETDGLAQTDADGNLLPLRERTHFGRWMVANGVKETSPDPARKVSQPEGDLWSLYEDQITPDHEWQ